MTAPDDEAERLAARAAALLRRPGAWLEEAGDGYALRTSADRRRRPTLRLDEAAFAALAQSPGLKPRDPQGYVLAAARAERPSPPPGRPGQIEGERVVEDPEGRVVSRRANLGESPIAWLARRRGPDGRPWLTPAEAAAGERLRDEVERAGMIGRLTMGWDAQPRRSGGGGAVLEPVERAQGAKARVRAALEAVGPGLREVLERVCVLGSALETAERELKLPRRAGKAVLKLALQRLAAHYRLG